MCCLMSDRPAPSPATSTANRLGAARRQKYSSQYSVITVGETVVLRYFPIEAAQIGITNGSTVVIKFLGIPANAYIVQMTTNLTTPWWPVSTNTAGMDGSWLFQDSNAIKYHQAFYRIVRP